METELLMSKRQTLENVVAALDVDPKICDSIPQNGLKDVTTKSYNLQRAKKVIDVLVTKLCSLVVHNNDDAIFVKYEYRSVDKDIDDPAVKVKENLVALSLHGSRNISTVAQCALAQSMTRFEAKRLLASQNDAMDVVSDQQTVGALRRSMEKAKFTSLRKTYSILVSGKDIPKHDYTFRVDAAKIAPSISFLQESLQVKPGYVRDVNVAGHVFTAMPVYERGGKTKESLFQSYKNAYPDPLLQIGKPTFYEILKLITKRGETKAGLSTYYIRLRYSSKIFFSMLGRLRELQCFDDVSLIAARTKELGEEWDQLQQFMMWSYSNQHVRIIDEDTAHCAAYALGGVCHHEHLVACAECVPLFTFFDKTVSLFLTDTVLQELNDHEFLP